MIALIENSPSIIYRASHILHLRMDSAAPGEWAPGTQAGVTRTAGLQLTLLAVFKGRTRQAVGESFPLEVTQYGTGMSRNFAVPGVWSPVDLHAGSEVLAFCRNPQTQPADAADLLGEAFCELVLPASESLADVQLALQIENAGLAPAAMVSALHPRAAEVGYYFAEYLFARLRDPAFADLKTFDLLVGVLALPGLSAVARATLLDLIFGRVYGTAYASEDHVHHFAAALFRLLDVPEAALLHDNILGVFLPNLLGIRGGAGRCRPEDVFASAPAERERAAAGLQSYRGSAKTQDLQEWLK